MSRKSSEVTSLPVLAAALSYLERGFQPVPVRFRSKAAEDDWKEFTVTRDNAARKFSGRVNVGLRLGVGGGQHRLVDGDFDCPEVLITAPAFLPPTDMISGRAGKPRSHYFYLSDLHSTEPVASICYRDPVTGATMLELRCGGGGNAAQTVVPPSVHECGEQLRWEADGEPATVDGGRLKQAAARAAAAALFGRYWPDQGARHKAALTIDGWLARADWSQGERASFIEQIATVAGDEELKMRCRTTARTEAKLASGGRVPGFPAVCKMFPQIAPEIARWLGLEGRQSISEDDLALAFVEQYGDDLRSIPKAGRWMMWDGTHWHEDAKRRCFEWARLVCRDAAQNVAPNVARAVRNAKTRAAVISLSEHDDRIATEVDQWDADPALLNTPGGTVDLRTGAVRGHQRTEYITKITAVTPDASCPTPLWQEFLERITAGDQALQSYLQRMAGYLLTGETREHALFFLYGTGSNGKSTFISTISNIVADYHRVVPMDALMWTRNERHTTELAGLAGARIASAIETGRGRNWDEPKVMMLTGGDKISARFMRQDFFDFTPQFKLLIAGNHKPGLRSVNEAVRRRLHLVPFTVTIPPEQRDQQLMQKLQAEWPGILAWMVAGCLEWQRTGLAPPQAVTAATDDYLVSQDIMAEFIEEYCEIDKQAHVESSTLFSLWKMFTEERGEKPGHQRAFNDAIEQKGHRRDRTRDKAWMFHGLRLKPSPTRNPHGKPQQLESMDERMTREQEAAGVRY